MATTFPTSPTVGQVFVSGTKSFKWDGTAWRVKTSGVQTTGASLIPTGNEQQDLGSPTNRYRDLYLSSNSLYLGDTVISTTAEGALQTEVSGEVVEIGGGAGVTAYQNVADLPTSEEQGSMAYIAENNRLYLYNGTAWFNIAIVNQAPTAITGNQASYELALDGTPTVVTLASTDPEGLPLTWSATTSGDTQVGTVTNTDNVFTITPTTNTNNSGLLNVTFSVTDGNNTETSISSFTLAFLSPLWVDTTLSIGTSSTNALANSTFIDRSTNALTVTPTGTPIQTTFHPYLENWSFEGKQVSNNTGEVYEDQVWTSSATGTDFAFGIGDYTIEFWFKRTRTAAAIEQMFQIGSGATGGPSVLWYSNQNLYFQRYPGSSNLYTAVDGAGLVPGCLDGEWHHFAGVRDNTGTSSHRFYIDGLFIKEVTTGDTDYNTNDNIVYIGDGQYGQFQGYISNVRVTKGAALYTGGSVMGDVVFTPPTEKLTTTVSSGTVVLLTGQSNRYIDNSASGHTLATRSENVKISNLNPFGQESEYAADGNKGSVYLATGDEVVIAHNPAISAGTGDFCLQFWTYGSSSDNASYKGLVAKYSATTGSIWLQPNSGVITAGFSTSVEGTGTTNIFDNAWHHIAFTRSGTAVKVFVDGVQDISFTSSTDLNNTADMLIGDMGTLGRNFKGYVADLKYDVGNAVYTSAFTPPTEPVGNTNAELYLPMDNVGVFDKTGNQRLTLGGNTSTSTTQTKFADTAMYFDGTGDFARITNMSSFGTSDFTVEGWIYNLSGGASRNIADARTGSSWTIQAASNEYKVYDEVTASYIHTTTGSFETNNLNSWIHIAWCRSGSTSRFFINGTQVGSDVSNSSNYQNTSLRIGSRFSEDQQYFQGYIENFQILEGVAKYTTNFTPPTGTQGRSYQQES